METKRITRRRLASLLGNLDGWLAQEQRDIAGLIMARWLERQARKLEARRAAGQDEPAPPRPNRQQRRASQRRKGKAQPRITSLYKKQKSGGKAPRRRANANRPACHLRRAALALYAFVSGEDRIAGLEVPNWMKDLTLEEILEALEAAYEILTAYGRDVLDAFLSGNAVTILGDADFFLSRASQTLNSEVAGAVLHGGSLVLGGRVYHTVELADGKRQKDYPGRTICHPFRLVEHWAGFPLKKIPNSPFYGRQRAIHETLVAILFGTFSEETVQYPPVAVASYRAWRERHGLVDFTASVRGANLTPCFEQPEPMPSERERHVAFLDPVLQSGISKMGIYKGRLIPCLAAGRTLPHTRLIAPIQMSEVVQHRVISTSLTAGLRIDVNHETTPLWSLFGARVGETWYREVRRRFKAGQLLLFLSEGTRTSFPGCVKGEAALFWDLELVCRSTRDDELGEVRLLFLSSPMSVPQRALAYQSFAWLPPPRQLFRLPAQRATLERMQKRRPPQKIWETLDEDLQMGFDGMFSIDALGKLRWGDTVIETLVRSESKGSVGQEFREANGLTHSSTLVVSGHLIRIRGLNRRSIDELEMDLSPDRKDWRPRQDFEVGSSNRQQAWNYSLLARETDFARGIVWSDRIEPAELLPSGMSRAEWREKWKKKTIATTPQPGTAASAPAPSAPAQAPIAPAPAASASAPTPAAPAPTVVQVRGAGGPSRTLPSSNTHQPELHRCMVPRSKFATHLRGHCAFDGIAVQEDYPVHRGWMALRLELWHAAASLPTKQRDRMRAKRFPGGVVPVGQAWDGFAGDCDEEFYMDEELLPFVRTHLQRSIVVIHEDNVALSHMYLSFDSFLTMEGAWVAVHRTDKGPTVKEQQAAIREGVICRDCRQLQWAFSAGNLQSIRTKGMRSYLVDRERKSPEEASSMADELANSPKTVLPAAGFADWPLSDVSSAILGSDDDCIAFADGHPLLSAEALHHQLTATKKGPLDFELWRAVAAIEVSFDQVHVYDDATPTSSCIRLAHSADSVKLWPAAFQWRRSGHIGVTTLCLVAMTINATTLPRKQFLLGRVQRLLHGLRRVEQENRSGAASMDKNLVPLSAAAHALIAPTTTAAQLAPLADAYASAQPPADISKLLETYHTAKSKLQELADEGDAAAKELLEVFQKDRAAIMAMDKPELKKQAKRFEQLVDKIEDEFNKGKTPAEKRICPRYRDTKMPAGGTSPKIEVGTTLTNSLPLAT